MSAAVVIWLTSGGIPEFVATPEVEGIIIDFMGLAAGDPPPVLTDAQRALLKTKAPDVLFDIERAEAAAITKPAEGSQQDSLWEIPQANLEHHFLSGPFFVQPAAWPVVERIGLDPLLSTFTSLRGTLVGETKPIGETGLEAYFGFDDRKPNGEAFFVEIRNGTGAASAV